jgi:hypothetical protein
MKHGVTASLPPSTGRAAEAVTLQPESEPPLKQRNPSQGVSQELQEFVVRVVHAQSGRVFSPFIVCTREEGAARKLCQRGYLLLQSVEPYIEQEGIEKPRILPYGPPVSDRDFERDYGSRPADHRSTPSSAPYLLAGVGWFFCGPLGAVLGWWAGSRDEGQHTGD